MKEIDKEIVVLRNMIDVLNRCLMISISRAKIKDSIKTKKDIKRVKKELNRLLEARDETGDELKEKKKDANIQ